MACLLDGKVRALTTETLNEFTAKKQKQSPWRPPKSRKDASIRSREGLRERRSARVVGGIGEGYDLRKGAHRLRRA